MNKNDREYFTLSFPEAKGLVISGDIHGNFNQLFFKFCVQYRIRDRLLIVAGDYGKRMNATFRPNQSDRIDYFQLTLPLHVIYQSR